MLALRVDGETGARYSAVLSGRAVELMPGEFTELAYYVSAIKTREVIEVHRLGGGDIVGLSNVVIELRPMD